MARFEFTMVSDAMMQGLLEAGATGNEIVAYQMLIRGLPKDRSSAECWMPADMAEAKVDMRADVFSRALRGLCSKMVTTADGERRTVLTKLTRGCKGHCPHYEDTLGRLIAEGAYPPPNARQSGHAIGEPNARQKQAPITEFSTLNCKAKTTQLQGKNDPIARQGRHPIETRQDLLVAAALLPSAEQGGGVSEPTSKNRDPLGVVQGEPPRATAGAAKERPAAALASWAEAMGRERRQAPSAPVPPEAEWRRVARILETQGLDALTESDRATYSAGHKAYAAEGVRPEP